MAARLKPIAAEPENLCTVLFKATRGLKKGLIAEAARQDASINDVGVGALARRYEVAFRPSGRRPAAVADPDKLDVALRMPGRLKFRIQLEALETGSNTTDTVVRVLSEEFGVSVERSTSRRKCPFGGGPRTTRVRRRASRRRLRAASPSSTDMTGHRKTKRGEGSR